MFNKADYAGCDLLIDLDLAVNNGGLSLRQLQVLYYYYFEDLTQVETARRIGTSRWAVKMHDLRLKKKIYKYLKEDG